MVVGNPFVSAYPAVKVDHSVTCQWLLELISRPYLNTGVFTGRAVLCGSPQQATYCVPCITAVLSIANCTLKRVTTISGYIFKESKMVVT